MISLVAPFLIIFVGLPFTKYEFDFNRLLNYVSEHRVVLHDPDEAAAIAGTADGGGES